MAIFKSRHVSWNRQSQENGGMPRGPLLFTSGTYMYPTQRGSKYMWGDEMMKTSCRVVSQNCWFGRWDDDSLVTHKRPWSSWSCRCLHSYISGPEYNGNLQTVGLGHGLTIDWKITLYVWLWFKSKKISNDQELIQSNPISCPQNQKGNNWIHKLTTVYERHSRQTEWTALSQIGGHSAT